MTAIPYDPDFDVLTPTPSIGVAARPQKEARGIFDCFSGSAAFIIGLITALLLVASAGFFILLFVFFL